MTTFNPFSLFGQNQAGGNAQNFYISSDSVAKSWFDFLVSGNDLEDVYSVSVEMYDQFRVCRKKDSIGTMNQETFATRLIEQKQTMLKNSRMEKIDWSKVAYIGSTFGYKEEQITSIDYKHSVNLKYYLLSTCFVTESGKYYSLDIHYNFCEQLVMFAMCDWVRISPTNISFLKYQMKVNNYSQAIKDAKVLIRGDPTNGELHYLLGLCYQKTGNESKAEKEFSAAKKHGYTKK